MGNRADRMPVFLGISAVTGGGQGLTVTPAEHSSQVPAFRPRGCPEWGSSGIKQLPGRSLRGCLIDNIGFPKNMIRRARSFSWHTRPACRASPPRFNIFHAEACLGRHQVHVASPWRSEGRRFQVTGILGYFVWGNQSVRQSPRSINLDIPVSPRQPQFPLTLSVIPQGALRHVSIGQPSTQTPSR
jgi:hypothetical protein